METKKNIYTKLAVIMNSIGYLQKDKKNTMQGYSYLSEAKIKDKVREQFGEQALVFRYSTVGSQEHEISPTSKGTKQFCTVAWGTYEIIDSENPDIKLSGEWRGTGTDTGDKGLYKAITGGIKYVFNTMFLIPTGDDPENENAEEPPTNKPKPVINPSPKPPLNEVVSCSACGGPLANNPDMESRIIAWCNTQYNGKMLCRKCQPK